MPFLEKHQCRIDFQKSAVVMAGKELVCVDKFGRPLVGGIQVVRNCTVPDRSQATLRCRVNCREIADLGVVERMHGAIRLANNLNRLDCRKELLVHCVNPFPEPVRLSAGALVGKYHSIQEVDVGPALETVADTQGSPPSTGRGAVPEHMADLYGGACGNCTNSTEHQVLAQLLREYSDVFSRGNGDMGLAKVIFHEKPLAAGTTPIRQPTRRLGPKKKKEVRWHVQDFLDRDLIELAHGGWSSLVVLVKKKDGSWRFCVNYRRLNSVTIQDEMKLWMPSRVASTLVLWICLAGTGKCPSVLMPRTKQHSLLATGSGGGKYCHLDLRPLRQLSNDSWSRSSVDYTGRSS